MFLTFSEVSCYSMINCRLCKNLEENSQELFLAFNNNFNLRYSFKQCCILGERRRIKKNGSRKLTSLAQ